MSNETPGEMLLVQYEHVPRHVDVPLQVNTAILLIDGNTRIPIRYRTLHFGGPSELTT